MHRKYILWEWVRSALDKITDLSWMHEAVLVLSIGIMIQSSQDIRFSEAGGNFTLGFGQENSIFFECWELNFSIFSPSQRKVANGKSSMCSSLNR